MSQAAASRSIRVIPAEFMFRLLFTRHVKVSKTALIHFERIQSHHSTLEIYRCWRWLQELKTLTKVTALTKEACLRSSVGCFSLLTTPIVPAVVGLTYLGSYKILHQHSLSQNLKLINTLFYLTCYLMPKEMISYGLKSQVAPFLAKWGLRLGMAYFATHLFHKILLSKKRQEKQLLTLLLKP